MVTASKSWGIIAVALFLLTIATTATAKYAGGSGTADDPYQIATAEDLIVLGESPGDYDKHFILTDDIDLDPNLPGRKVFNKAVIAPDTVQTTPSFEGTPFTGIFDGNGHTVSHLTIKGRSCLGLFGHLASAATVKDLGLVSVKITGSDWYVGALVGLSMSGLTCCYGTGTISGKDAAGGLIGDSRGSVTQCYSTCIVSGNEYVGGLVGWKLFRQHRHELQHRCGQWNIECRRPGGVELGWSCDPVLQHRPG